MAFKKPKVPEYRRDEGAEAYLRKLILFLRDFCQEAWMASGKADKGLAGISFPVTSVNGRTGDVMLDAAAVGARASSWTPTAAQIGALEAGGTAANASRFGGKTWAQMLAAVYPVGSIYMSAGSTSPAALFGGTWEQLKDRFLLGAGGAYAAGAMAGAANVTLTVNQIPAHTHNLRLVNPDQNDGVRSTSFIQYGYNGENSTYTNDNAVFSTGGGASHSNMPPYLAVYMWKRVG